MGPGSCGGDMPISGRTTIGGFPVLNNSAWDTKLPLAE